MRIMFYNVFCSVVFICLTQELVKAAESEPHIPVKQDEIDQLVNDKSDPQFTTRDYDDSIEPLSVEKDGAPNCAPVVYGDEADLNEDNMVTQDQVVRKLREEFFRKHKESQKTPAPAETKNEGGILPEDGNQDLKKIKKDRRNKNAELWKLREEYFDKHKNEINLPEQRNMNAEYNDQNILKEEEIEKLNEIDMQKENKVLKQHWNQDKFNHYHKEAEIIKHNWNKETIEKINRKDKKITLIPDAGIDNSVSGFKNDPLQRGFHEEIYGDTGMEGKSKVKVITKLENKFKNRHGLNRVNEQYRHLLDLANSNNGNFKNYKKLMNIELKKETTNPHQHDKVYGPSCVLKKLSIGKKSKRETNRDAMKQKRRKRNVRFTQNPNLHTVKSRRSKKTTKYIMDIDGRFRDIESAEASRNRYSAERANATTPNWLNYDNYVEMKTKTKFRPRPPLRYNRVMKEPLDYGSYDKSQFWRMMTELKEDGTLPTHFYEDLPTPEVPNTKEVFDVCIENFTTSECWRYPDISRLRDTRERKFMRKYYNRHYPDMDDDF